MVIFTTGMHCYFVFAKYIMELSSLDLGTYVFVYHFALITKLRLLFLSFLYLQVPSKSL